MAKKGTIGILTGGGDVPGLNPAIRAATIRAVKDGYNVIGIKNGWKGLLYIDRNKKIDEQEYAKVLDIKTVNPLGRRGGTFLHSSRVNPVKVPKKDVPDHLQNEYTQEINDLTPEVVKNLNHLGIEYLIPIGGDDTLSYGAHLHRQGFKVIAIPKTMDNDVPGTDYCLGFSTCMTRTVELTHQLRTCAGSHERFLVIEVMGRYAGFSALLPTMAGAADRCLIPEHQFDYDRLTQLLLEDKHNNPSNYSVVLVSEGAIPSGNNDMIFESNEVDGFGHKKLGGVGDMVCKKLKDLSGKYNNGKKVDTISQKLGYLVRSGDPDAIDSLVSLSYGNLAMNLIDAGKSGLMVCLRKGRYESVPIDVVVSYKKLVDVSKFYDINRYRPIYSNFEDKPMWIF